MSNKKTVLKIYSLGHPLSNTEWWSILGDKYCHALPFDYEVTNSLEDASIVAWDGIITLKQIGNLQTLESQLQRGKVLLIIGEAQSLYQNHPMIKFFDSSEIATIRLNGWSVLPEELLAALEACFQKIVHV
jgi:hypothetical protein